MAEQTNLDAFEQLLSAEYERMVAGATDPRPAAEIAATAMRPRGMRRTGGLRRSRRYLLLGLAAVFLIPAAYIGARVLIQPELNTSIILPSLPPPLVASLPPSTGPDTLSGSEYVSIVLRHTEGSLNGVSAFAIRPDGAERLLRNIPTPLLPEGNTLTGYGTVSRDGWLALGADKAPWQMVLVDLADPQSDPWVVNGANLGGVGPAWGPTGLIAASASADVTSHTVLIADPETRNARVIPVAGVLPGGGPYVIWNTDGTGLVGSSEAGGYKTMRIDGGTDTAGFPDVFEFRGDFGPNGAELRICSRGDGNCNGDQDGRVDRFELDGAVATVYEPVGSDRVLQANFVGTGDEYILMVDRDAGRRVAVVRVTPEQIETLATIDRAADWKYVFFNKLSPDSSMLQLTVVYPDDSGAALLVPLRGAAQTSLHEGNFTGYMRSDEADGAGNGEYEAHVSPTSPPGGARYQLPDLDEFIAAEVALNPRRVVHGQGSRDSVAADAGIHDYTFTVDRAGGPLDIYVDCLGPQGATVTVHGVTITHPCLQPGSYIDQTHASVGETVTVHATGDTSWRVVLYGMSVGPDGTPPPVAEPATETSTP